MRDLSMGNLRSDENPVEMVKLMLHDLRGEAGEGPLLRAEAPVEIGHRDLSPAGRLPRSG